MAKGSSQLGSGRAEGDAIHSLSEEEARGLADIFKALADPTRLKLLHALLHAELTVGDLTQRVTGDDPITISAVSHHLRLLRGLHVVRDRREGKHVYYALDDEHIAAMLRQSLDHIGHL
jgi:ArsR family transcriptional regulator, lead/cadmium/zinc/bismuth-responsive transcriptional repressor